MFFGGDCGTIFVVHARTVPKPAGGVKVSCRPPHLLERSGSQMRSNPRERLVNLEVVLVRHSVTCAWVHRLSTSHGYADYVVRREALSLRSKGRFTSAVDARDSWSTGIGLIGQLVGFPPPRREPSN